MGIKKDDLELQEIPGLYEGRMTEAGDFLVAFEKIAAGDPAPFYRGLPDDRCQARHWGFLFKGKWVIRYADHEEEVNAGEAYYMAPGHLPLGGRGLGVHRVQPEGGGVGHPGSDPEEPRGGRNVGLRAEARLHMEEPTASPRSVPRGSP